MIDALQDKDGSQLSAADKEQRKNLVGSLVAGIAAVAGQADAAATATGAAQVEIENNYLGQKRNGTSPLSEQARLDKASSQCFKTKDPVACKTARDLQTLSANRDRALNNACSGSASEVCRQAIRDAQSAGNDVIVSPDGQYHVYPVGSATIGPVGDQRDDSFQWQAGKSVGEGVALGVIGSDAGLLASTGRLLGVGKLLDKVGELLGKAGKTAGEGAKGETASIGSDFFSQTAQRATHNPDASEVVLGRYVPDSPSSYEMVAQARGSTYFSMEDWNAVSNQVGADKMWNINKAFLEQQVAQGKNFVFTGASCKTRHSRPTLSR